MGKWLLKYCEKDEKAKDCMDTCGFCDRQNLNCGVSKVSQSRVVNGEEAKEGAWPWIASLQIRQNGINSHFCGGTILTPTWVKTVLL